MTYIYRIESRIEGYEIMRAQGLPRDAADPSLFWTGIEGHETAQRARSALYDLRLDEAKRAQKANLPEFAELVAEVGCM